MNQFPVFHVAFWLQRVIFQSALIQRRERGSLARSTFRSEAVIASRRLGEAWVEETEHNGQGYRRFTSPPQRARACSAAPPSAGNRNLPQTSPTRLPKQAREFTKNSSPCLPRLQAYPQVEWLPQKVHPSYFAVCKSGLTVGGAGEFVTVISLRCPSRFRVNVISERCRTKDFMAFLHVYAQRNVSPPFLHSFFELRSIDPNHPSVRVQSTHTHIPCCTKLDKRWSPGNETAAAETQ